MSIHYFSLADFRKALTELSFRYPLLVLSRSSAERWGLCSWLERGMREETLLWLPHVDANPTEETVAYALVQIEKRPLDGVVAVGGGSAIDLAKIISALYAQGPLDSTQLLAHVRNKEYLQNKRNALPLLAVPSTAGTGSELTQWATLWGARDGAKYSVDAPWLLPAEAWIVPELTLTLPVRLTLATGLDALCHAAEAFWARARNPLAAEFSLAAMRLISENLPKLLASPEDPALREKLCAASVQAGLAFSMTRTTACHSISYPLTALYGVEHGLAAALTLAEVAKRNRQAVELTLLDEIFEPFGGLRCWLDETCGNLVTLRLSAFGIPQSALAQIVQRAFTQGRMNNNPVDLTPQDVEAVLRAVY